MECIDKSNVSVLLDSEKFDRVSIHFSGWRQIFQTADNIDISIQCVVINRFHPTSYCVSVLK